MGFGCQDRNHDIFFKAFKESEQHESGYNLEIKFCDLSLILWE